MLCRHTKQGKNDFFWTNFEYQNDFGHGGEQSRRTLSNTF
jgi:hypothetical protein